MYADLHLHTTASDGDLALADVPATARGAGLGAVAVTDHDRLHPGLDRPVSVRDGVTIVRGVELRVETSGDRVDLLGYGVEATDALCAELDRVQRDRVERGRRMVARVESEVGVDLGVTVERGFGRPHLARAVVAHPDTGYDRTGAVFADLIAGDGPCYVAREVPAFETGRRLLADAAGLVGLAHPLRYDAPAAALALCADLDAVERFYPYTGDPDPAPVERAVERHDLVETGGSDAHGTTLGTAGLSQTGYDRVGRFLPTP